MNIKVTLKITRRNYWEASSHKKNITHHKLRTFNDAPRVFLSHLFLM